MQPRHARLLIGAALVAALSACTPTGSGIVSVTIDGGDRTIVLGDPLALTATVATNGDASDAITWASSDETVATIDASGAVISLTAGTTDLTATSTADPTKSDTVTLTVDPPGVLLWTRQFGTANGDEATGIATDANGDLYVTGRTAGALEGTPAGDFDAFVRAYDADGTLRWTRQFGTASSDSATGVASGAGVLYVTGRTFGALEGSHAGGGDAFVRAYDGDGTLLWTRQFGTTSDEYANAIATDANGNVYATGTTFGGLEGSNAGGGDAFVRAYDADGTLLWTRQFGTTDGDFVNGVATDANGNVYVAGRTSGALQGSNAGSNDAFVRAYDADGTLLWTHQFGTTGSDFVNGVATDANGNLFVAGRTSGALEGSQAGGGDAFVRAYDADGTVRWTHQFGTANSEDATGIATGANGRVHTVGTSSGALEGVNNGLEDAYVRTYDR